MGNETKRAREWRPGDWATVNGRICELIERHTNEWVPYSAPVWAVVFGDGYRTFVPEEDLRAIVCESCGCANGCGRGK